jgi:hypothetical protein
MKQQKKKLVKKITNPKKQNSINAVDGLNELFKDLKQLEVEHQQRDLEFKLNIDTAKRNEAIDKLIRVVLNKVSDLFNEVEKEFTQDEINLIEERIEVPDKFGAYNHEIFTEHIRGFVSMIALENNEKIIAKDELEKLKKELALKRNQKGKQWREKLIDDAKKLNKKNPLLSKIQCLKIAFENLPANQKDENDFDSNLKSIQDRFYKETNL